MSQKPTGGFAKGWEFSMASSPLEVARPESGARLIEQLLAKLDWGAAA